MLVCEVNIWLPAADLAADKMREVFVFECWDELGCVFVFIALARCDEPAVGSGEIRPDDEEHFPWPPMASWWPPC